MALALVYTGCSKEDNAVTYTVTFDTDGGSPVPSAQSVKAGEMATAPAVNPSKADYIFMFWRLTGTSTAYNFQTPVNSNITLQAQWEEESKVEYWQVSWNLNGGAWPSGDNHATQVVKGGTLAEPAAPVKAGATFDGWYKEAALTNKINFPYDVSSITANFTLYAKWTTGGGEPADNSAQMVSSGRDSYFVLKADGSLYAQGRNNYGKLGVGSQDDVENLIQVASGVASVSSGRNTTFIIKTDGSLLGSGLNSEGELGLGNTSNHYENFTPISVSNVKAIAAGNYHTLLLKNDGSLWATGAFGYGQLGIGNKTPENVFMPTNLTADVVAVAAGAEFSLALKKDGTVWGAGYGYIGTLGENGTAAENVSFIQLFSGAKAIAAGKEHSFILTNDGAVYASGVNTLGQLGIGSNDEIITSFTQAVDASGSPLTNVTAIEAGETYSFALKSDGTLWGSGNNNYGQLGIADEKNRISFTQCISGVKTLSAGRFHSIIVKNDGTVLTYGCVNPYTSLNGSGAILIKVNDTRYYQYINTTTLYDRNMTELFYTPDDIATGSSGLRISVKPGTYNLSFHVSNMTARHDIKDVVVADNETVTVLYEWVTMGYRWTITHTK
jgi:uncharacterized repeat protein (TIGR02543 family)